MAEPTRPPAGWSTDSLSKFLETSHTNTWSTFANHQDWFDLLRSINDAFQRIAENLNAPTVGAPTLLLPRCHSAFLAGVRLAASGQPPEAYMVLRGCLEFAMYGAFIRDVQTRSRQWLGLKVDRGEGSVFTTKNILLDLDSYCPEPAKHARYLYGLCIDQGAHPNKEALNWNMRTERVDEQTKLTFLYLKANGLSFDICLKTAAQVGITALRLFEAVFHQRFRLLGLTAELDRLTAKETELSTQLQFKL